MFGEKAFELIKELHRSQDNLPPFNDNVYREAMEEIEEVFKVNQKDIEADKRRRKEESLTATIYFRHSALERGRRCVIAYLYNRLQRIKQMRWGFGAVLPPEIRVNLTKKEHEWFVTYSRTLASYMVTIGDDIGLNLTKDMKPPKSLYIEVRCLVDYGKLELHSGEELLLKKNGVHLLPRSECESLIRQGILEHIV